MNVDLSWDPNPESDIASYNVYYANHPAVASGTVVNTASPSLTVNGLADGVTWYFAVSAINNAAEESSLSDTFTLINPFISVRH